MRDATSGQLAQLSSLQRQDIVRLMVEDHLGTMQDRTARLLSASVSANVDQMCATASVTLKRKVEGVSWAPMMNANDPVAEGRALTLEVAVIGQGDTVQESDYEPLFSGTVDRPAWGGKVGPVVLQCRDGGGRLQDTFIESEGSYGDDATPEDAEDVMQEILDDHAGSPAVTLVTVGTPDFGLVEYTQGRAAIAGALRAITDRFGWDLRYRYVSTASPPGWYLVLSEPDRTKTTADHIFGARGYYDVSDIGKDTNGVRNAIEVEYADGQSVTIVDAASVAEYRRRYMYVDAREDPQVTTAAIATILATAIATDLGMPLASQSIEGAFFWPVEIHDLYTWEANGTHYSTDQDMAVVGYEHRLSPDGNSTAFHVRGTPSGGTRRWLKYERRERTRTDVRTGLPTEATQPDRTSRISASIGFGEDGAVILSAEGNGYTSGILFTQDDTAPSDIEFSGDEATTVAAIAVGASSVGIDDQTGLSSGRWYVITDNSLRSDLVYVSSIGANTLTFLAGYRPTKAFGAGATVKEPTLSTGNALGIQGNRGTDAADGTNPQPTWEVALGTMARVKAVGVSPDGTFGEQIEVARRRGDTLTQAPKSSLSATRVGDEVTVGLAVEDPTLGVTALEWRARDGEDQTWGSYSSSWDGAPSGTPGTHETLSRVKTLGDPYTAFSARVTYTDENGDSQTQVVELDLASVQQIYSPIIVHAAELIPRFPGGSWSKPGTYGGWVTVDASASTSPHTFTAHPHGFAPGVVVDGAEIRTYRSGVGSITATLVTSNNVGAGTAQATIARTSGSGWATTTASFAYTVQDDHAPYIHVEVDPDNTSDDLRFLWVQIDAYAPSYNRMFGGATP